METTTTLRERPILFSGPMVRAILEGCKTKTRRIMKPQPWLDEFGEPEFSPEGPGEFWPSVADRHGEERPAKESAFGVWSPDGEWAVKCPYGQPGERLWVRETWGKHMYREYAPGGYSMDTGEFELVYAAGLCRYSIPSDERWRPSIHMPRWASRITLEITGVRVERLNEISEEDAIAEGIERVGGEFSACPWRNYRIGQPDEMSMHCSAPSRSFMTLWESIHGPGSWDANPWVWVVEFRRVE